MARKIERIIVHGADTPEDMDVGVNAIRQWHTDPKPKGNGWDDIGYHFVIRRDGTREVGRDFDTPGAHCRGYNKTSVGICLAGGKPRFNYTRSQLTALEQLIYELLDQHPKARVHGHHTFDPTKTCPLFDVEAWWYDDD